MYLRVCTRLSWVWYLPGMSGTIKKHWAGLQLVQPALRYNAQVNWLQLRDLLNKSPYLKYSSANGMRSIALKCGVCQSDPIGFLHLGWLKEWSWCLAAVSLPSRARSITEQPDSHWFFLGEEVTCSKFSCSVDSVCFMGSSNCTVQSKVASMSAALPAIFC